MMVKRRLGAHLSIAGGLSKAVERVVGMGGNCLQIFSGSPRVWQLKEPDKTEVVRFRQLGKINDVKPVFIHAKYLINLASDRKELVRISEKALGFDLKVAEMIGATGVIVHLGSHQGRGFKAVEKQLVESIRRILKASPGSAELMIENSAGQKGKIASQLEEISLLFKAVASDKLKWCLDTCHAYNAGFSLGEVRKPLIGNDIVKLAERLKILDKLKCLHVNDSRDEFGSGKDRHANLAEGKLGKEGLSAYVNHPKLKHLPMIIETPGFDGKGPDKKNLDILKSMTN